jgi:ribonuclease Z
MLRVQVLGESGGDNALFITADGGQGLTRLLLDCGGRTVDVLPFGEVQQIDHLLFSHLHMDHVAGFDAFFRVNFERTARENHLWGPPGAARILSHRFRGFWWNHAPDLRGTWFVHEVGEGAVQSFRFEAQEAFEVQHEAGRRPHDGVILSTPQVSVQAVPLRHQGVSLGFILREPERVNVNAAALAALGVPGGRWLAQLKAGVTGQLDVNGVLHDAAELRARLLQSEAGESAAYFTDFLLDEGEVQRLAPLLRGVQTLYVEAQYAPADAALAARHHHTTAVQGAALARAAGVQALVLLHLSRRYDPPAWQAMLRAAQEVFPAARFPDGWFRGS